MKKIIRSCEISICFNTDEILQPVHILQVNKPASIPVHPCGRYRHNTVVFILAKVGHADDDNGENYGDNNHDHDECFGQPQHCAVHNCG